ncbi:hypothetical protein OC861_002036 [Tilletia horrida]|nr:hypothetical protein OC861_002036 [Tilletia horrida]
MATLLPIVANQYFRTARAAAVLVPIRVQSASTVGGLGTQTTHLLSQQQGARTSAACVRAFSSSANVQQPRDIASRFTPGFETHRKVKQEMRAQGKNGKRTSSPVPSNATIWKEVDKILKPYSLFHNTIKCEDHHLDKALLGYAIRHLEAHLVSSEMKIIARCIPAVLYKSGEKFAEKFGQEFLENWFAVVRVMLVRGDGTTVKQHLHPLLGRRRSDNASQGKVEEGDILCLEVLKSKILVEVVSAAGDWLSLTTSSSDPWSYSGLPYSKIEPTRLRIEVGEGTDTARRVADQVFPVNNGRSPPPGRNGPSGGSGRPPPSGGSTPPPASSMPPIWLPLNRYPSLPGKGRPSNDIFLVHACDLTAFESLSFLPSTVRPINKISL